MGNEKTCGPLPKDVGRFRVDHIDKNTLKVTADTWDDPAAEILACFERMFWVEDWAIKARKALEAAEWGGQCMSYGSHCPVCKEDAHFDHFGTGNPEGEHLKDCILAAALKKAREG